MYKYPQIQRPVRNNVFLMYETFEEKHDVYVIPYMHRGEVKSVRMTHAEIDAGIKSKKFAIDSKPNFANYRPFIKIRV